MISLRTYTLASTIAATDLKIHIVHDYYRLFMPRHVLRDIYFAIYLAEGRLRHGQFG